MPVIRMETNIKIEENRKKNFTLKFSGLTSEMLEKPEAVMMVTVIDNISMFFAGNQEPAAYLELKSVGLAEEKCGELSEKICVFIERELGVKSSRIYIEYTNLNPKIFGWNKKALA